MSLRSRRQRKRSETLIRDSRRFEPALSKRGASKGLSASRSDASEQKLKIKRFEEWTNGSYPSEKDTAS